MNHVYQLRRIGSPATMIGVPNLIPIRDDVTVFGRGSVATVFLDSSKLLHYISRKHAELLRHVTEDGQHWYHIVDNSLNGTYVNDYRVKGKHSLHSGDIVTFGHISGAKVNPGEYAPQSLSEFCFVFEAVVQKNGRSSPGSLSHTSSISVISKTEPTVNQSGHVDQSEMTLKYGTPSQENSIASVISKQDRIKYGTPSEQNSVSSVLCKQDRIKYGTPSEQNSLSSVLCKQDRIKYETPSQKNSIASVLSKQDRIRYDTPSEQNSVSSLLCKQGRITYGTPSEENSVSSVLCKQDRITYGTPSEQNSVHTVSSEQDRNCDIKSEDSKQTVADGTETPGDNDLYYIPRQILPVPPQFIVPSLGKQLPPEVLDLSNRKAVSDDEESSIFQQAVSVAENFRSSESDEDIFAGASGTVLQATVTANQRPMNPPPEPPNSELQRHLQSEVPPLNLEQFVSRGRGTTRRHVTMRGRGRSPLASLQTQVTSRKRKGRGKRGNAQKRQRLSHDDIGKLLPDDYDYHEDGDQCASPDCVVPAKNRVHWVQCDDCDAWYHTDCAGCNYSIVKEETAQFHCGCV